MHPVIAMWAHPRSMSTAIERIMRERGDVDCLHEPFLYYYYEHLRKKPLPHFAPESGRPGGFDEVVAHIMERAEVGTVFFKDMSYYVVPEIFKHAGLVGGIRHLFLIRDPRKTIISYHKLDPGVTCEEIGLEAQWTMYEWITGLTGKPPMVIEAESVQRDPVAIIGGIWRRLGLSMVEHAFTWSEQSIPDDWRQVSEWHGQAVSSSGIARPADEDREAVEERFERAAQNHSVLREYLAHHWPYYLKLKSISAGGDGRNVA